jgi:hypothetical protein
MARRTDQIPDDTKAWIREGRTNIALWAEKGLGIILHRAQIEFAEAVLKGEAGYYLLTWANRAGKTTILIILHMHRLFYKLGMAPPETETEERKWRDEEYRTLHCAPLSELAGRAWLAIGDIINGTSKAQRDPVTNKRRPAPLAQMFAATKERTESNADRIFLRCLTGAVTDFRSTEGKAARIEGGAWRLITWDEWPATENPDDIRYVLKNRLTARAADYDAAIVLTGTITAETEHIAKEFIAFAEDPRNEDWWGNTASRDMNPGTSIKSLGRALRNLDQEDYARSVLGIPGGVKGRMFPSWLIDPVFDASLPNWQPPDKSNEGGLDRWTYLHVWDLAIAAADNVGMVVRIPFDWRFSVESPLTGVMIKVIPGSRTLVDAEIEYAITETFLPYGGVIYVDATDSHGMGVYRNLRRAGLPIHPFDFKEQEGNRITRKAKGLAALRAIFSEGIDPERDEAGERVRDSDGLVAFDLGKRYGSMRLPSTWSLVKDQLAVLKPPPEDLKQKKDAAMTALMAAEVAFRERRGRTRSHTLQRAGFFARRSALSSYLSSGQRTEYAHPADK